MVNIELSKTLTVSKETHKLLNILKFEMELQNIDQVINSLIKKYYKKQNILKENITGGSNPLQNNN